MKTAKTPLLVAFFTVAIDLLGFGIVVPLLPRYAERFQSTIPPEWQGFTIGMLMASFSLVQFLFAPVWGKLSDRHGRRPILLVGLSGSVLAYTLFAYASWAESLSLLFLARIGQGLCGATISTAQAVIADCTAPEERARGMALIGAGFGIGFTLGPVIGAFWVGAADGPPSPMPGLVAAAICCCAFLFAFFRMPETNRPGGGTAARKLLDLAGYRYALGTPVIALPLFVFFVSILAFGQFEGTIARLTKDVLNFTDRDNFLTFFYVGLVLLFAQGVAVRKLVPIMGEVRLVRWGIAIMLLGMLGLATTALWPSIAKLLLGAGLATFGFCFLTSTTQALISRATAKEHQGEILGVAQSCGSVARILGPLLGNVVYGSAASGHHEVPYYFSAGLLAVALVFSFRLLQPAAATTEAQLLVAD